MTIKSAAACIAVFACAQAAHAAEGESIPDYYVGAAVGSARPDAHVTTWNGMYTVDGSTTGWNLFAGVRAQKWFGAEIGYFDFGKSKAHDLSDGTTSITYQASAESSALAGFLVGYLPFMPEHWDLIAKAGFARLSTTTDSNGNYPDLGVCNGSGSCPPLGVASYNTSDHSDNFAYGLGVQYRFDDIGVRLEYDKISGSSDAKPSLLSLGVTWAF